MVHFMSEKQIVLLNSEQKVYTNLTMMIDSNDVPLRENAYIHLEMAGGRLAPHLGSDHL